MSKAQFTPGPWEYEEHQLSEGYSCIVYAANGMRVGTDHLGRADAALIASAPDLYEALAQIARDAPRDMDIHSAGETVENAYSRGRRTEHFRVGEIARAALAKAEPKRATQQPSEGNS